MKPLTVTMVKMLKRIGEGRDYKDGIRGMSARGGADATLAALHRRGLVINDDGGWLVLTEAGREALR